MDRYLKELPEDCDRESVRKKLDEEYLALGKVLRNYFQHWCQPLKFIDEDEDPSQALVYIGPAVIEREVIPSMGADLSSSLSSINEWLALKQHVLKEILKENPPPYEEIQSFLQQCLQSLEGLIESILYDYERLVCETKHKRVNYKEMLSRSDHLQGRFTYFFRHSSLLFHPDKSGGDETIGQIKTELFQEFQQVVETSLERLNQGLVILKQCIPPWELELAKLREKLEQELIIFREELNKRFHRIETKHTEISIRQAAVEAQHAVIKEKQAEMEAEQTKMEAERDKIKKH